VTSLLITDARIVTPTRVIDGGWLLAEQGVIAAVGAGEPDGSVVGPHRDDLEVAAADGAWLLPGFVDVHVHGALGHEAMDGELEGLDVMARFYARHGVTSFLATTWTASTDETLHALHGVVRALPELAGGARLLGAHMEGPYLNPRRCGAQDAASIRPATPDEASRFLDTGVVRLITVAPEVEGNLDLIAECVRRGIAVSAGHTDATYEQLVAGIDRGVRHVTHTFNAMRPLHHREPGVVGGAMTVDSLTVELIADDIHVDPVVMKALYAARGHDGVVLVTDAMRATGMPPGSYAVGERTVVLDDGAVRLPDGSLAGSVLTFDTALRNLARATGCAVTELWPVASRNAAGVAGVGDRKGSIVVGYDADLVLFDDDVRVELTVVEGQIVHRRASPPPGGLQASAVPADGGPPMTRPAERTGPTDV
jgi:N-acetylglucosamine-6-phosphate deacetylase